MTGVSFVGGSCQGCRCDMTVAVVIPAYNAAGTIGAQLASLAAQTFDQPWTLVLSDNGSTDATVSTVRAVAGSFHRLLVVDASATRGPAFARNAGAASVRTPQVLFLDADDVTDPDWLVSMTVRLAESSFVGGKLDPVELNDPAVLDWRDSHQVHSLPVFEGFSYVLTANMGVSRELFESLKGFDQEYRGAAFEDVDFAIRASQLGVRPLFVPEAVVHYRHRGRFVDALRQARAYGAASAQVYSRHAALISPPPLTQTLRSSVRLTASLGSTRLRAPQSRRAVLWSLTYHVWQAVALRQLKA